MVLARTMRGAAARQRGLVLPAAAALVMAIGLLAISAAPSEAATGVCGGKTAKVRGGKVVRGGPRDDVLIGSGRSQTILGGGGDDRICAGGGNDIVRGGAGNDAIHGEGRGDRLFGGAGADGLYGDILDDKLFGGGGPDLLVGGHGVDRMFGGGGDDLLRGGANLDCYYGQDGANTASFATATPPGPAGSAAAGVRIDLASPVKGRCPRRGTGRADGDGDGEPLSGIRFVVGSAFADEIRGVPGAAVDAGLGEDACSGFGVGAAAGCAGGEEKPAGTFAYVFQPVTGAPPDPGLIVSGSEGAADETVRVAGAGAGASVTTIGASLVTGTGCDAQGTCTPAPPPLGYLLVYGGDGADAIGIGDGLPPDATVDADGGPGDDALVGSDAIGEVLLGGDFPGADLLDGRGGGDALISGGGPASGPDTLLGGYGDDQLVTDYPCAGHSFSGGAGADIAGFARSAVGIRARLGGVATLRSGSCPGGRPTAIRLDHEVLEGTIRADRLIGSARSETIWGRDGDDVVVGRGGADRLEGFSGRDLLDARDGRRDRLIDCGSGRDRGARHDPVDPRPLKC
jgi:Ca2+-binding RTX toxin-like protein